MSRRLGATVVLWAWLCALPGASQPAEVEATYVAKCAKCHGRDGVPKKIAKGAPNFNDLQWQNSTSIDQMVRSISAGKGKIMTGFEGKLSPEEILALAEYVRSMAATTAASQ